MTKVHVHDLVPGGGLAFDLCEVLQALETQLSGTFWEIDHADEDLWVMGRASGVQRLNALAASGTRVTWAALLAMAVEVHQTVWGEFRAFHDPFSGEPYVIIRAIDSSYFEVESADLNVIAALRNHFTNVHTAE